MNQVQDRNPLFVALSCVLLTITLLQTGCKHLEVRDRWFDSDRVAEVPSEILPIWTDTVLHQPNNPGIRGFGGRVYFYEEGKPDPVQVDGQLVVYAFDGNSKDPKMVAPLRKYVITADQLTTHHSDTSLGHSYSVWVPWDRVGGEGRTLSLVVRFDGRQGGTAMSKPSRMLLPGIDSQSPLDNERKSGIQLASHEANTADGVARIGTNIEPKIGMETSSIDLPPSFQRRLWPTSTPLETAAAMADTGNAGSVVGKVTAETSPQSSGWSSLGISEQAKLQSLSGVNSAGISSPSRRDLQSESVEEAQSSPAETRSVSNRGSLFASPESELSAHYEPQRFPARRKPKARPGHVPLRRQPHPGGWQSGLPPTPRSGWIRKSNQGSQVRAATELPYEYPTTGM